MKFVYSVFHVTLHVILKTKLGLKWHRLPIALHNHFSYKYPIKRRTGMRNFEIGVLVALENSPFLMFYG